MQITQSNKEKTSKEERTGFAAKIREKFAQLIKKLRALFTRIRELPGKIRKLADGILKKKISLEKTWNSISMFWHDEQNQKAFRLIRKRIGKLVRYVLPDLMILMTRDRFSRPSARSMAFMRRL